MHLAQGCVEGLVDLFVALAEERSEAVEGIAARISGLEGEADDVKHSIRSALPSALFLPVPRQDLLALLSTQDAIADQAEEVASLIHLARQPLPLVLRDPFTSLVERSLESVKKARVLVDRLDELIEVGFRGREVDHLLEGIEELSRTESAADRTEKRLVGLLFEREAELGPLAVIFWYDVSRILGRIADEGENVGDRLRLLVAS